MKDTQKSAKSTTAVEGFSDDERAAMKERVQELKAAGRRGPRADKADGESAVLATIAAMPEPDRAIGERLHAIIRATAPAFSPKLWYGMPAYARDGKVVCFFQAASKFKTRYATFGFMHEANLDDGAMWPTAFALKELTAAEEAKIAALVRTAAPDTAHRPPRHWPPRHQCRGFYVRLVVLESQAGPLRQSRREVRPTSRFLLQVAVGRTSSDSWPMNAAENVEMPQTLGGRVHRASPAASSVLSSPLSS